MINLGFEWRRGRASGEGPDAGRAREVGAEGLFGGPGEGGVAYAT